LIFQLMAFSFISGTIVPRLVLPFTGGPKGWPSMPWHILDPLHPEVGLRGCRLGLVASSPGRRLRPRIPLLSSALASRPGNRQAPASCASPSPGRGRAPASPSGRSPAQCRPLPQRPISAHSTARRSLSRPDRDRVGIASAPPLHGWPSAFPANASSFLFSFGAPSRRDGGQRASSDDSVSVMRS